MASRKRDLPPIEETPKALRAALRKAVTATQRRIFQMLLLVAEGKALNQADAAFQLGVSRTSVRGWLKRYLEGGSEGLLARPETRGRQGRLRQPGVLEAIERRLNDPVNAPANWKDLWQEIEAEFHLGMTAAAFYAAARKHFPHARAKRARPSHILKKPGEAEHFKKTPGSPGLRTKSSS